MFCENCGKPIPEGQRLCDACAAPANAQPIPEPVPEEVFAPTPVPVFQPAPMDLTDPVPANDVIPPSQQKDTVPPVQAPAFEMPVQQPAATVQPAFELNMPAEGAPKKKKKKGAGGKIALIIVALLLVVGIVFAAVNWNSITRFFKRNFAEPKEYLAEVEKDSVKTGTKTLAQAYDQALENVYPEGGSMEATVTVKLGEQILDEVSSALESEGIEIELDWVENILIEPSYDIYEDTLRCDLGIGVNGVRLATASMIWDLESQTIWVGIPELHETFVEMDAEMIMGEEAALMAEAMAMSTELMEELLEAMPTGAQLEQLVDTYYGIVVDHFADVEKTNETVKVGGVEQDLLVMSVELSQKDIAKIIISILEEAQEDALLEEILEDFSDYANDMAQMYGEAETVDIYEQFQEAVSSALDEMESALDDAESGSFLTIETFIDDQDTIVGRTFAMEMDGEEVEGHYIAVTDGKEFAFEAEMPSVEIVGDGTVEDGKYTGKFEMSVEGTEYLTLKIKDCICTEDGQVTGSFTLIPDSDLYELMELDSTIADMLSTASLTLTLEDDAVSFAVEALGAELFSVGVTGQSGKSSEIELPTDGVSIDDDEGGMQWVSEWDVDGVVDRLEEAGVPDEYMETVREFADAFQKEFD